MLKELKVHKETTEHREVKDIKARKVLAQTEPKEMLALKEVKDIKEYRVLGWTVLKEVQGLKVIRATKAYKEPKVLVLTVPKEV